MAVLLLAEVTSGELNRDATAKAVTAVASLGDVTVLACGAQASDAAAEAAGIAGVARVLCAEDALYGHRLAEPAAALLVNLAADYDHIAAPATTDAKNIMPRVAALLDVMILSDVSGVVDADTFERPVRRMRSTSKPSARLPIPACRNGLRTRSRKATVPS